MKTRQKVSRKFAKRRGAMLLSSAFWITIIAFVISFGITTTLSLKVSVSIPELVKLNDAFWLNCTYKQHLEHQSEDSTNNSSRGHSISAADIYAIKWYKDDEEFYRFLPNAQPKISIYETNGIQLDQTKSHEGNVFLSKADVHSEGNYRCEILSEAPLFETVRKSKHLKVYALPVRGPRIEILDANGKPKSPKAQEISYAVGEKIELRCNSAPSKPAARLRWYLNDHELTIPTSNSSTDRSGQIRLPSAFGYDVRVTPVEYRQHYKGIYSSHSTLNLLLQQDDLINNKISFKCLASMRQEVPIRSKQLILMAGQISSSQLQTPANSRTGRSSELIGGLESDTTQFHHRPRPQHHRHSVSRLSSVPKSQQQQQRASLLSNSELISNLETANKNHMLYIYEDSDSTLGPSIIDRPENLANHLQQLQGNESENFVANSDQTLPLNNNYAPLEFNRADNLEYIQLLRDRLAHQRSFPGASLHQASNLKRAHGVNSLVKSPFYLDENDPLRPIISWPPLDSGKLMLLPSGQTIVAIPTPALQFGGAGPQRRAPSFVFSPAGNEQRLVLPSRLEVGAHDSFRSTTDALDGENQVISIILEKLMQNLNCTCTDGSIDTKLAWFVDDVLLETRDTHFYPTRISADHKQTLLTIGIQLANILNHHQITGSGLSTRSNPTLAIPTSSSLQTLLKNYLKNEQARNSQNTNANGETQNRSPDLKQSLNTNNQQQSITNNQIKFACRAMHSMLLYSSSEMITFDFNPTPTSSIDGNSIEKFASLPSNVIQATSASQSSSAWGLVHSITTARSQTIILSLLVSLLLIHHRMHANIPLSGTFKLPSYVDKFR